MDAAYKHCKKCGEVKPVDEFYKNVKYADGLQWQCIDCQRGYSLIHQQAQAIKMQAEQIRTLELKIVQMCVDCPAREHLYVPKGNGKRYVVNNDGTVSMCQ